MSNNFFLDAINSLPLLKIGLVIFGLIIFFVLIIGFLSRISEHKMYRLAKEWNEKNKYRSVKRK